MDPRHESMNQRRDSKVGVTSVNCLRIVQQTTITHHDMAGQRGPVPVYGQASGRDLTQEVLDLLSTKQTVATETDLADIAQAEIKAALDRLASRNMITYETNDQEQVILTKEGEVIANEGSHEFKVWDAVKRRGQMPLKELQVMLKRQSDDKRMFC
jgi:predicted transcriptional regulator